jgi:NAD(P)H-flavin reductase
MDAVRGLESPGDPPGASHPAAAGHATTLTPAVVRVRDYRSETHDTFTLTLEPPAGEPPYAFRAGQFNMLYAFGVGEAAISVSGDPGATGAIVHTIRAVGSVTNALAKLRPGDALGLRGPFGSSWPVEEARGRDVVFVTGGIGLAPLRPALYEVLRRRADFGRVVLLHGSRTPADLLYAEELASWARRGDCQVLVTVDRADPSWQGNVGVVTTLVRRGLFDPAGAIAMTCGPDVMMRFVIRELEKYGVAEDRVYLSLERNMQCAIGSCGHCQFGPHFICLDGPVFRHDRVKRIIDIREV